MDGLLARALRAAQGMESGCDAEMAAAYVEGRLGRSERDRLESHLARCTACRALTAAMLEESAPSPVATPARAAWTWRWAVPALAGIAVLGSVVYYQRDRIEPPPAAVLTRPAEPQPTAAEPETAAPAQSVRPKPVAPPPTRQPRQRADVPSQEGAVASAPMVSALRDTAPPAPQIQEKVETAPVEERLQALRLREQDQAANRISATTALPVAPLPEGAPLRAMVRRDVRIWAVSDGGRIFRSIDSGRNWEALESPTKADLVRVTWESESTLLVEDKEGNGYRIKP